MLVKAKRLDNLEFKVSEAKNKVVVKYLNSKGYKCGSSKLDIVEINNKLKSEGRRVVIEKQNEVITRLGSYYIWEAKMKIKIMDVVTGEEI